MKTPFTPTASPAPAASAVPAQPSSTVVLLRDGRAGLEVLLLQRHVNTEFLGGAYVFPGGRLDAADLQLDAPTRLDLEVAQMQAALAESGQPPEAAALPCSALGLYVAAARETFEECGVLLATGSPTQAQLNEAARLLQAGQSFHQMLIQLQLRLQTSALLPWSRWITPAMPGQPGKRFDTRFFVAPMPPGQTARHDAVETTASVWLTPRQALEDYWHRNFTLAPPQIMTLAQLCTHADLASVLDAARRTPPCCVHPQPVQDQGEIALCYPGDPAHSVAARALPGPTRLYWRNRRYEPQGGLAELMASAP